jgi:hypothetical protein
MDLGVLGLSQTGSHYRKAGRLQSQERRKERQQARVGYQWEIRERARVGERRVDTPALSWESSSTRTGIISSASSQISAWQGAPRACHLRNEVRRWKEVVSEA